MIARLKTTIAVILATVMLLFPAYNCYAAVNSGFAPYCISMAFNGDVQSCRGFTWYTDILGGNRAGLFTILVVPLDRREFFGTKISRMMEKLVMHKIRRQQAKK
jgi:hypothetical protein